MGILEKTAGNSLQKALRKGQASTKQYAQQVKEELDQIKDCTNWLMKNQQKTMEHLNIEVIDPLEE